MQLLFQFVKGGPSLGNKLSRPLQPLRLLQTTYATNMRSLVQPTVALMSTKPSSGNSPKKTKQERNFDISKYDRRLLYFHGYEPTLLYKGQQVSIMRTYNREGESKRDKSFQQDIALALNSQTSEQSTEDEILTEADFANKQYF